MPQMLLTLTQLILHLNCATTTEAMNTWHNWVRFKTPKDIYFYKGGTIFLSNVFFPNTVYKKEAYKLLDFAVLIMKGK